MIYSYYCDRCCRYCDISCLECSYYSHLLLYRISKFEEILFNIKDVFDNCEDPDPLLSKVRLNNASAFDTAVQLFDDIFSDSLCTDHTLEDYNNLPDQFPLHFF